VGKNKKLGSKEKMNEGNPGTRSTHVKPTTALTIYIEDLLALTPIVPLRQGVGVECCVSGCELGAGLPSSLPR